MLILAGGFWEYVGIVSYAIFMLGALYWCKRYFVRHMEIWETEQEEKVRQTG